MGLSQEYQEELGELARCLLSFSDGRGLLVSRAHAVMTSLQHYLSMLFTLSDREQVKNWVDGWNRSQA